MTTFGTIKGLGGARMCTPVTSPTPSPLWKARLAWPTVTFRSRRIICSAAPEDPGQPSPADAELAKTRQQLSRMMTPNIMTGRELRELVFEKWGRSYDVRIQRRGNRLYLHVMWKHLEQQSFPLSEEEYMMQLDAVAEYLTMWEVTDLVRAGIKSASKRGPGYTGGGSAKAISIPLGVDLSGARSGEWNSFLS